MAATWILNDLITRVEEIVQSDVAQALNLQRMTRNGIRSAIERYTRDAPDVQFNTLTGDGSQRYPLVGFNAESGDVITTVEHPIDVVPPNFLDFKEFMIYRLSSTTWELLLLEQSISNGVSFKVNWSIPRTIATVVVAHKEAFAYLSAHFVAASVAAREAGRQDGTINAATVDKGTGATAWQSRSREFFNAYKLVVLPLQEDENTAAEETSSVESTFAGQGAVRVFHRFQGGDIDDDSFFRA